MQIPHSPSMELMQFPEQPSGSGTFRFDSVSQRIGNLLAVLKNPPKIYLYTRAHSKHKAKLRNIHPHLTRRLFLDFTQSYLKFLAS